MRSQSFYDNVLRRPIMAATSPLPAVPTVVPQPTPPIGGTIPVTMEAQARRAHKLALDNHRTPTAEGKELRRQLKSREKSLLRELDPITRELAAVRAQLASLANAA